MDPMSQTFPTANQAYEAWSSSATSLALASELGDASKRPNPDPVSGLEVRETFRKLRNHFQLFGFLTDATLDGFVSKVLRPNARCD